MGIIIITLITVHCIADYPLQGDFLANIKGKNFFLLMVHSWIWSGLIWISGTMFFIANITDFLVLLVGHMLIDKWKCSRKDKSKALTTDLYIDQALHMVQIGFFIITHGQH